MDKLIKTVYTAGVFDCFHIGHLNILKKAKEIGDKLIVGISTDELVKKYKGISTIIPFEERMEIVRSIKYVDEVIPQNDRNKIKALDIINFDIWVIGDDWYGNDYYMNIEKEFLKRGVKTDWLPYTKGISSTKIRDLLNTGRRK
jgi:glycerol-3-phosphate cytidylyltransferase